MWLSVDVEFAVAGSELSFSRVISQLCHCDVSVDAACSSSRLYHWILDLPVNYSLFIWCFPMMSLVQPRAGSGVERIDPFHFLARNQAVSVRSLGIKFLSVLLFIRATCLCLYVLCLLVVLVKLRVLAKWLARNTPLNKPFRGKEINSTKPRLQNVCDFFSLIMFHSSIACLCCPRPYTIYTVVQKKRANFGGL